MQRCACNVRQDQDFGFSASRWCFVHSLVSSKVYYSGGIFSLPEQTGVVLTTLFFSNHACSRCLLNSLTSCWDRTLPDLEL